MATAMMLDDDIRAGIKALINRASMIPVSLESTKLMAQMRAGGTGTWQPNSAFTILIPMNFRVTYTHEYQREDLVCRHISISLDDVAPGRMPHPTAVALLLKEFGFINEMRQMPMWITEDRIVEFIEPLDGDIDRLRSPA